MARLALSLGVLVGLPAAGWLLVGVRQFPLSLSLVVIAAGSHYSYAVSVLWVGSTSCAVGLLVCLLVCALQTVVVCHMLLLAYSLLEL